MLFISVTNTKKKKRMLIKAVCILLLVLTLSPYVYQSISADSDTDSMCTTAETNSVEKMDNYCGSMKVNNENDLADHWQQISYHLSN